MSQSKPSTRSSNKGQRFDKNYNRVEEAVEEVPFITQTEEVISPVGRNDTTLVGTDEADDSHWYNIQYLYKVCINIVCHSFVLPVSRLNNCRLDRNNYLKR